MLNSTYLTLLMGPTIPRPVPGPVIEALTELEITSSARAKSGFQMTFAFGQNSPLTQKLLPSGFFDPKTRVVMAVTLGGQTTVVMDGLIGQQEIAPGKGVEDLILVVSGGDLSVLMDQTGKSGYQFPGMSVEAQVRTILGKYATRGLVAKVTSSPALDVPGPTQQIPTQTGTDLDYLKALANDTGYVFYISPGPTPGVSTAYWGPEDRSGPAQPALTTNMDTSTNVQSLRFMFKAEQREQPKGWLFDPESGQISEMALPDIESIRQALARSNGKEVRNVNMPGLTKFSPSQSNARARALMANKSDAVTAQGTIDVLRYGRLLEARKTVGVRGAGPSYDGLYYVESVTHRVKPGGYSQSFSLSRNGLFPLSERVRI